MPDGLSRRSLLALAVAAPLRGQSGKVFDVLDFGAAGDGKTLDTAAFQKAIDAASVAGGSQVLVRGGRKYLISTLDLKGGIDFHLADDAQLLASTDRSHYPPGADGLLTANGAQNLTISGTGGIDGRALEFMTKFDKEGEIWEFGPFRPKIFVLTACRGLELHDITFGNAPFWGLHMLGCEHVLVDGLKVRNLLDVPNCDGIDPDHCRDVEIRNCDIVCGDDAIVVKTTRQPRNFGPSANIHVHDCVMETKDSGLKIGTETTGDIHDIRFERCEIKSGCRAITIQLRDEGNVSAIEFSDIKFIAHYQAAPWWGRGEAISLTAMPRTASHVVGKIHDVRVRNATGRAENSVRIDGVAESRLYNIILENVAVAFDRWTQYPGGVYDNRPSSDYAGLEKHDTPGIHIRYADRVTVKNCKVAWGENVPDYFTYALEAEHATDLAISGFTGEAAHPARDPAIFVR